MKLNRTLLFVVILFAASCAAPKPFVFKGLKSIKIEKASLGKNVFNANFAYQNPNHFELILKQLDCDVLVNDQPFTHYHLDTAFTIPANTEFVMPAKMEIELSSILKHSVDILFNKPMKITVKGDATLSKGIFTKHMPIEFSTEQKLNLKEALKGI
jgi:LEA14-like dessication related protein